MDISPEDINIVDVLGDGNCLYRTLSLFLYGTEDLHLRIRNEIYNTLLNRIDNLPDITMNTENGPMRFREYINNIQNPGFFGGELEISTAIELYNINIATYEEVTNNSQFKGLSFLNYYSEQQNNENRHLLILININGNHFRLGYVKNHNEIDNNYKIEKNEKLNEDKNDVEIKEEANKIHMSNYINNLFEYKNKS